MAVNIEIMVLWVVVACSMVVGNQHFRGHAASLGLKCAVTGKATMQLIHLL